MSKKEIVKELREILKVYHYESDTENMSKDVVTSLENIIIGLTSWLNFAKVRRAICMTQQTGNVDQKETREI